MKLTYPDHESGNLSDQTIWKQFIGGNLKALSILYERYYRWMRLRAYRLVKDWEEAHEITQDIFVKLMELGDSYASEGLVIENMKAWLYSWIKRHAQNHLNKRTKRSEILRKKVLPNLPTYSYLDQRELSEKELIKVIESLKNPTYQLIISMDYVGYKNAEIAEKFGKPTTWVNRNRYKARLALSRHYAKKTLSS